MTIIISSTQGFKKARRWAKIRSKKDEEYQKRIKPVIKDQKVIEEYVTSEVTIRQANGSTSIQAAYGASRLERIVTGRELISSSLRKAVLVRDNFRCRYCGKRAKQIHLDHVIPVALNGPTIYENLVTSCASCNLKKGTSLWKPKPLKNLR